MICEATRTKQLSTSTPTTCRNRNEARGGTRSSREILGTSMTYESSGSTKNCLKNVTMSTICGTRTSRISTNCDTLSRCMFLEAAPLQEAAADPAELLIEYVKELGTPANGCLLAPRGVELLVLHHLLLQQIITARGVAQPLRRSSVRAEARGACGRTISHVANRQGLTVQALVGVLVEWLNYSKECQRR